MDARSKLRKPLLQKRQALSVEARSDAGIHLLRNLKTLLHSSLFDLPQTRTPSSSSSPPPGTSPIRVAGYLAVKGEIDVAPSLGWLRQCGHTTYLPVIRPELEGRLLFAALTDCTEFKAGRYQIPEPVFDESDLLDTTSLDLVLVPLVGFDRDGNRLGMGGGFYDRTFSFKLDADAALQPKSKPFMLGVGHEFQLLKHVPAESWDVPLDAVITNQAIYTIN